VALSNDLVISIKDTLIAGGYSLLLGAGASFDSRNIKGDLPLGDILRRDIVELKKLRVNSSLARAYATLTPGEIDTYITDRFANCIAGPTLLKIPEFNWRRIYTLNIDDALEAAYKAKLGHQQPVPLTQMSPYMEAGDVDLIQLVHLHGWAGKPEDGYVFSLPEYASTMVPSSAWTSILAHTIASEPFLVAGTSLEEPDLEYFLSGRHSEGVRKDRGPSFLIEPNPDPATEKECERHGLHLYQGTLLEFLTELDRAFPSRPLPANATSQLGRDLFSPPRSARELTLFSRDFSYIVARQGHEDADLSFYVGRKPTPNDIALGRDISRASTLPFKAEVRRRISAGNVVPNFLVVDDNAGAGKTTILARTVFDLAGEGYHIFEYRSRSTPNLDQSATVFNSFAKRFIIFCDDFADHAAAFFELHKRLNRSDYLIIGSERSYRINHIIQTLAGVPFDRYTFERFNAQEARDLIITMDKSGLASLRELERHAVEIAKDPVAVAVCRIMKDFRPVEDIIRSLIDDSDNERIERYVACALATYCYKIGLAHSLLSAAFKNTDLPRQFQERDRLPLSFSDFDTKEYVVPTNPILGQRILYEISQTAPDLMFEVYCAVGAYVAPYVNRQTIRRRTPEARLAQRLFDYDDVVSEFIPAESERFYLTMKRHWEWNSRYWEQFALLKLDRFIKSGETNRFDLLSQSISHARHAVQIERHPFCLTTLGRILLEQMQQNPEASQRSFDEAFEYLDEAIKMEGISNRVAIHPYMTLFNGISNYIKQSGVLSRKEADIVDNHLYHAEQLFGYDRRLLELIGTLRSQLSA
jgi:hypothetical protein